MEEIEMYRQGDVLIVTSAIPKNAEKMPHCVLVHGVATGHSHRIETGAEQYICDNVRYVRVTDDTAQLVHEEHATIDLPKGEYAVRNQKEYSPAGNVAVID